MRQSAGPVEGEEKNIDKKRKGTGGTKNMSNHEW